MRTATKTEQCGHCKAPVVIGRWTVRSRYTDKPLCDRCGTVPLSAVYDDRAAKFYDESIRCVGCGQMRRKSVMKKVGEHKLCKTCRDNGHSPGTYPNVERALAARAAMDPGERAYRDSWLDTVIRTGRDPEEYATWDPDELRFVDYDEDEDRGDEDEYDERGDSEAELRFIADDGTAVYGEEPTGEYRSGVAYAERYWAPGAVDDRWRDFESAWTLA